MCDYSLHGINNRLAVEGEVLVVHRFLTGSKGLTSPQDLETAKPSKGFFSFLMMKLAEDPVECAVCIPDGAKLRITGIAAGLQYSNWIAATEIAIFRQLSMDEAAHRDAVEFSNGARVLLQEFDEGQRIEVLALSSEECLPREGKVDAQTTFEMPW